MSFLSKAPRKYLSLCWLLCLTLLNSYGQDYPTVQYTNRDGLAQMQVMCLLKDSRGYLWVGTKVGLSRFDGQRFESFQVSDGLLSNTVLGLTEDRKGNIWISFRKGLVKFDGRNFTPYPAPPDLLIGTAYGTGGIAFDDQNQLVVLKDGDWKLYTLQNKRYKPIDWPELKGHPVKHVLYDPATNALLVGVEGLGIYQYRRGKLSLLTNVVNKEIHFNRTFDGHLVVMGQQPDGSVLHYCQQAGQWVLFMRQTTTTNEVLRPMPFDYVISSRADNNVLLVEKNTTHKRLVFSYSFSLDNIKDELGFWLATEKGLVRVFTNGMRYFPESQVPYAWSVVEDRQGAMWFLNYGKSLQRFDGQTLSPVQGYREVVSQSHSDIHGRFNEWYYQPLRDKRGNLWLSNASGIVHYDGRQFRLIQDSTNTIAMALLEDPAHDRVIQAGEKKVLFIENKPPFRILKRLTPADGLDQSVYYLSLAIDHTQQLWVGAGDLTRYDEQHNRCYTYSQQNGKLPGRGVLALTVDSRGNLWAALAVGGLALYDKRTDTFRTIGADVFSQKVNALGLIDSLHLMVGNVHNLHILDLAAFYRDSTLAVQTFNHHNGFLGIEPGQNGFYKDSRGYVWVPSGTVLSRLDPRQLSRQTKPLQPHFTHLNNQRLPFAQTDSTFSIPYGQNRLNVSFDAIGYDQPFETQFSYQVLEIDSTWSAWQTDNNAVLSGLASGRYTLQLKVRTGSQSAQRPAVASLGFSVSIPFWQSPFFYRYATLMGSLLLLVAGFLWYRERRSHQQLKAQSRLLAEQETRVRFLQIQTIQAQMNPHFTFNVLATLQTLILDNDRVRADQHLVNLSKLIRDFLESTLLPDEQVMGSLYAHEIPLEKELELLKMYVEFEQLQFRAPYSFEFIVDDSLLTDMCYMPPLLIQPYVENAIKHGLKNRSTPGHLSIQFSKADETLTCTITDDGIGREAARKLQAQSLRAHQSRGTELVEKRVAILNQVGYFIFIKTSDLAGVGTVVVLSIGYDS